MPFTSVIKNDIAIEIVNLKFASKNESVMFKEKLLDHLRNNYNKIVIDLSSCELIDTTFLSAIISVFKEMHKSNGRISLVVVHTEVQSLIDITGMHELFLIFGSREEAIKALN